MSTRQVYCFALTIAAALAVGAGSAFAQNAKCPFAYNDKTRNQLVLPALRAKEGDGAKAYDLSWPDLTLGPERIEILFSLKGAHAVTAPDFLVVIDRCKRSVISAERTPHVEKQPIAAPRQIGE